MKLCSVTLPTIYKIVLKQFNDPLDKREARLFRLR
jgi:hypothetical protein